MAEFSKKGTSYRTVQLEYIKRTMSEDSSVSERARELLDEAIAAERVLAEEGFPMDGDRRQEFIAEAVREKCERLD